MEWSSPWLNESQIRPIDQSEQICKQSYVNVGFVMLTSSADSKSIF